MFSCILFCNLFFYFVPSALAQTYDTRSEDNVRQKRALVVDVGTFKRQCLERHNLYRSWHGVPPLTFSDQLNDIAEKYANKLAAENNPKLEHSNGNYGENLYYYTGRVDGFRAVDNWYNEYKLYNFNLKNPPNFSQVGHFTQLVWSATKHLGAAVATSRTGRTYVVCTYSPQGNSKNQFKQHVYQPKTRG